MIFPFLRGIPPFSAAPFTWCLVYLNVFIYCTGYVEQLDIEEKLEKQWSHSQFIDTTALSYSRHILENRESFESLHVQLAEMVINGDETRNSLLATLALRDVDFLENGMKLGKEQGDQVATSGWGLQLAQFRDTQFRHPSYIWGLSVRSDSWMHYFSYQFAHGSLVHLMGNMFYLLIFGCFIELMFGSFSLLVLYFLSGILAAVGFVAFSGLSYSPLIGASGAVSGLMGFVGIMYWKRNIAYAYFILPLKDFLGLMYLPGWTVLIIWLLSDLAGLLGSVSEFGGVAHSAHLAGALAGGVMAGMWSFIEKDSEVEVPS